jgi:hypothetical protein
MLIALSKFLRFEGPGMTLKVSSSEIGGLFVNVVVHLRSDGFLAPPRASPQLAACSRALGRRDRGGKTADRGWSRGGHESRRCPSSRPSLAARGGFRSGIWVAARQPRPQTSQAGYLEPVAGSRSGSQLPGPLSFQCQSRSQESTCRGPRGVPSSKCYPEALGKATLGLTMMDPRAHNHQN